MSESSPISDKGNLFTLVARQQKAVNPASCALSGHEEFRLLCNLGVA